MCVCVVCVYVCVYVRLSTGRRQHKPWIITKEIDVHLSPMIMAAAETGEVISTVVFASPSVDASPSQIDSTTGPMDTYTLKNCYIGSYDQTAPVGIRMETFDLVCAKTSFSFRSSTNSVRAVDWDGTVKGG